MRDYAEVWLSMKVKLRKLEEAINQKKLRLSRYCSYRNCSRIKDIGGRS